MVAIVVPSRRARRRSAAVIACVAVVLVGLAVGLWRHHATQVRVFDTGTHEIPTTTFRT